MATLTLDTYRTVERLTSAGMPEKQAKAVVETLREVSLEDVATKQDLANLKSDIFKWAVPLLLGQVVLFTGIVSAVVGWTFSILK